jgi:hypothetical protein
MREGVKRFSNRIPLQAFRSAIDRQRRMSAIVAGFIGNTVNFAYLDPPQFLKFHKFMFFIN